MQEFSTLTDIVDINKWQKIQDHFSEALGVSISTLDRRGKFISEPSNPARLCDQVLRTSVLAIMRCKDCLPERLEKLEQKWKDGVRCPFEFFNFFIPARVLDKTIAYILVGPVILGKRPDINKYREEAERIEIDSDNFLDALREIKIFSFYGIKSIIELLYDIASYILQLEYQNTKLKSIVPEFTNIAKRVYSFYVEKLLGALLDVSFNLTETERGSLMLFDSQKNELYIKLAKGIDKNIIEKTRLRIGEGIAGIVAQEMKPLFIDDTVSDQRIRERLYRPDIKSSLSMPIKLEDRLLGILNISTLKVPSENFSPKSIEAIDKLIKLVETTLRSFPEIQVQ